jgi:hypothetical protein
MQRNRFFFERLSAGLIAILAGTSATAHHGVGSYDMSEVREVAGVVVRWEWKSPHTWLTLAADADGERRTWEIEGAPPQWMSSQGFTPTSLESGESVEIVFHPVKNGADAGILMEVRRANGEVLKVNRPARLGGP